MYNENMKKTPKQNRIDIRVSDDEKHLLEQAASLQGKSLSRYILDVAKENAKSVVKDNQRILLNNDQRNRLLKLLEQSPKANKELIDLLK